MPKMPEKLILTGCDEKTEWQLPWFLDNYSKHNSMLLAFANFGVSERMLASIEKDPRIFCIMNLHKTEEYSKGWFYKPLSMYNSPSKATCWIDTDCQVLGNLEYMFSLFKPNTLNMVKDRPWLKRRGEDWFNSGVVGFINKPEILMQWMNAVKANPMVGDQEVLHQMLNPITRMTYINELPNEYNWLRLQVEADNEDSPKKKIMHWTGEKGNDRIRGMMKIRSLINA